VYVVCGWLKGNELCCAQPVCPNCRTISQLLHLYLVEPCKSQTWFDGSCLEAAAHSSLFNPRDHEESSKRVLVSALASAPRSPAKSWTDEILLKCSWIIDWWNVTEMQLNHGLMKYYWNAVESLIGEILLKCSWILTSEILLKCSWIIDWWNITEM